MKILFIGYWGANEGLSQATINPHLEILADLGVKRITYTSIERNGDTTFMLPTHASIRHQPIIVRNSYPGPLQKIMEMVLIRKALNGLVKKEKPDIILCRSALAGIYGLWLHQRYDIPFYVESYEPHGDYMVESGVWRKNGISNFFYQYNDKIIRRKANGLMPVAKQYVNKLKNEGYPAEKLWLHPCGVDLKTFHFTEENRLKIRRQLTIPPTSIVGIYVGKFGGMYMQDKAFRYMESFLKNDDTSHIILLSDVTINQLVLANLSTFSDRIHLKQVSHPEVPAYLSAADIGFSFYKPSPSKRYLSPIKHGEYWACGLPILIPTGIGDDSELVSQNKAGWIWNEQPFDFSILKQKLNTEKRADYRQMAEKHRNFDLNRKNYQEIITIHRKKSNLQRPTPK